MKNDNLTYFKTEDGILSTPCKVKNNTMIGSLECEKCEYCKGYYYLDQWIICRKKEICGGISNL